MKTKTPTLLAIALLSIAFNAQAVTNAPVIELENTVLTFPIGGYSLSEVEATKLKNIIADAKAKGKITKIELAVWSDKEHPTTGELPKADEKLASERIKAVKKAIHDDVSKIEHINSYNMAENSHWLGRYFHSSEAEIDAAYSKKGDGELARADYSVLKQGGAPSKAVVVIKIRAK